MNDLSQALENVIKYTKLFSTHKVNCENTGVAEIDKIGEVVYTRVIPDVRINDFAELVIFNDGNSEYCGGFAVREPFTSIGICNDFVFDFNDSLYTITSIYKFKALENKLAMFKLLGIL